MRIVKEDESSSVIEAMDENVESAARGLMSLAAQHRHIQTVKASRPSMTLS